MHMLYPLLNQQLTNAGERDFDSVVRLLLYFEDVLIKSGQLPSDFVFMICRSLSHAMSADAELLAASDLFDAAWYQAAHPEAQDPIYHYLREGAVAGFDPSPQFNTVAYLTEHKDVAEAGVNPLIHYLRYGILEGRVVPLPSGNP
jgi:hypothetical protein